MEFLKITCFALADLAIRVHDVTLPERCLIGCRFAVVHFDLILAGVSRYSLDTIEPDAEISTFAFSNGMLPKVVICRPTACSLFEQINTSLINVLIFGVYLYIKLFGQILYSFHK